MKRKRIIITHAQVPFVRGGAELLVENLKKQLLSRNFEVEIVLLPYKDYPMNSICDNLLTWRMIDIEEVNGEKVDLVIGTKFPSYGIKHTNKVIWLVHQYRQAYDLFDSKYGLSNSLDGEKIQDIVRHYDDLTIKEAKKCFTISENVSNRLKSFNDIQSEPLYHPPSLVGRYYNNRYDKYILSVGRLNKLKRNEILIESMKYCDSNIKAIIAGKGTEMQLLRKLAEKLNLNDRIQFVGFVSDEELIELYANAGLVYYAPLDEDYGYVTLEAFLSQKPVITCKDSGGTLEFVENNINGVIADPNPEILGEKINEIMKNKNRLKEMGTEGFMKVKDINWDNVIDKLTQTL